VKKEVFLLISLLLIAVPANLPKVSLLLLSLVFTAISFTLLTAIAEALLNPLTIVCELTPCSTWSLISLRISPASTTTDVVPSPTSASCDLAISVRIRAAGCTISSSCICQSRTGEGRYPSYLHNSSAIICDRLSAIRIHKQQIPAVRTQRTSYRRLHSYTSIDITDDLPLSLRRICAYIAFLSARAGAVR
jgi:hypothetical protein